MLRIKTYIISGTLTHNDFPGAWNGSTWTLWNEFICYILIAIIVRLIIKHNKLYFPIMFLGWLSFSYLSGHLKGAKVIFGNGIINVEEFIPLFAVFMAGAMLYILKSYLRFDVFGGIVSLIISALVITLLPKNGYEFASPFIMFIIFVMANKLPSPQWIRKNDLSYGVYLISFPIQQLIDFALKRSNIDIPFYMFFFLSASISISLAYCSWKFIEAPSLKGIKKRSNNLLNVNRVDNISGIM